MEWTRHTMAREAKCRMGCTGLQIVEVNCMKPSRICPRDHIFPGLVVDWSPGRLPRASIRPENLTRKRRSTSIRILHPAKVRQSRELQRRVALVPFSPSQGNALDLTAATSGEDEMNDTSPCIRADAQRFVTDKWVSWETSFSLRVLTALSSLRSSSNPAYLRSYIMPHYAGLRRQRKASSGWTGRQDEAQRSRALSPDASP